jgi:class 3 adenylate cyclase
MDGYRKSRALMATLTDRDRLEAKAKALLSSAALGDAKRFDYERRARKFAEALSIYRELGDKQGQAEVLIRLGNAARNIADFPAALDYLQEAEKLVEDFHDPILCRELSGQLLGVLMDLGDYSAALEYAKREWDLASKTDDSERRLMALNGIGCSHILLGEHEEGVARLREGIGFIDGIENEGRRGHLYAQALADLSEAFLKWGKPEEAFAYAEEGSKRASRIDHSPLVMLNSLYAGQAALALRKPALAIEKLQATVDLARRMGLKSQECHARVDLGNALAELGRHEEAFESYRTGHQIEKEIHVDKAVRRLEFHRARKEIEEAQRERENAERVLFTVLPKAIATRMTQGEARIAEEVPDVSVLFADLVGFNMMSTRMKPRQLLELLERVFSEFDRLTASFQLEKVKTIGDAYMAVGGALTASCDHLEQAARLAVEMVHAVERMSAESETKLAIRLGLHAGPAIAGVIGTDRLCYDLWGETVNLASRLESSGMDGRIHVSAEVAERLKGRFRLEPHGPVKLKGFGEMRTFLLGETNSV